MTLVTSKPLNRRKPVFYNGIDRLFDDFLRFDTPFTAHGNPGTKRHPAVNILETEKDFQLEFLVPGWEKSDFQVKVEKDILVVEALQAKEDELKAKKEDGITYRLREFGRTGFKRSFQIPETVKVDAIDAKYHNGILTLTLPKLEELKSDLTRTIEIG